MSAEGERRIRFGVVGCGAVSERYHLPALARAPDVELVALVDPVRERAATLAERFGAPVVGEHHRELVGRVDAAVVAAPNRLHEPVAVDLLAEGVHVLVEKPMALDTAECDRMIDAASSSGAVLAVGHDFRFFPTAGYVKDLLSARLLGRVRSVDLRQGTGARWPYASGYALSREEAGGGVLIDFGSHMLDLLLWWLGDADVLSYRDDAVGGVEAECVLELAFADEVRGVVELSRARELRDTFVLECERGRLEVGCFEPSVVRITPTGAERTLEGDVPDPEFAAAPLRTVFARQHADVVDAIRRRRREPLVSGADGRRVIAAIEACYARREPLARPWDVVFGSVP